MENIRLKVLAGFKAGESASHLSKIYALSLDQVLEWKRLTIYGHTDWVDGARRKYSIEEKRLILGKYFSQSLGYKRFAAINNLSCRLLKNWIRKVKKSGSIDLAYPSIQVQLSSCKSNFEIIAWAVYEVKQNQRSTREVADQLGYNIRSVQRWCRQYLLNKDFCHTVNSAYQQGTTMAITHKTKSERQNQALMRWIKNNFDLKTKDTAKVISQISELHGYGLSIQEACSLFGIHRSTYYRKLKQRKSPESQYLVDAIKLFQTQHHYSYGAKRMAKEMSRRFNQPINHKRVARLMKLNGLNATIRRNKKLFSRSSYSKNLDSRPVNNLIKRNFVSDSPRKKLVSDMTFFHTAEGWLVLSTIKDLCTKEIIAWDFDTGATVDLAIKTLDKVAYCKDAILHSDQGGTYTSPMYRDKAESYNLVLSYSRRGNCYDNACMENFYGHLKSETIYQLPITQRYCLRREELKNIIDNYIIWYNNERIQAKLNYLSPVEFCLKNYHQTVAI